MKSPATLFIFVLFIFGSCNKSKIGKPYTPITRCFDITRNLDTINLYIMGNWEWVEEYRVSRYNGEEYFTPNSPNSYHLDLKLSGDTANFFINNKPDSVYRFRIQREFEITNYPTDSMPIIVFYSFFTSQRRSYVPIMICKTQLLMQHQYVSSIVGERLWIRK